jgi:hypothetical protein
MDRGWKRLKRWSPEGKFDRRQFRYCLSGTQCRGLDRATPTFDQPSILKVLVELRDGGDFPVRSCFRGTAVRVFAAIRAHYLLVLVGHLVQEG